MAQAQGPSFAIIPNQATEQFAMAISPNGRYVTASVDTIVLPLNTFGPIRWDRQTGTVTGTAGVPSSSFPPASMFVLDDGRVFGWSFTFGLSPPPSRVYIWNPDTGTVQFLPALSPGTELDSLEGLSVDGLFGVAMTGPWGGTRSPRLIDFSGASPFVINLQTTPGSVDVNTPAPSGNFAAVTMPVDGVRYVHGSLSFGGVPAAARWPIASAFPSRDDSWSRLNDVTPRGEYSLGVVGSTLIVRGDGADRVLSAPTSPFLMSEPGAGALSDDGHIVVGSARNPALSSNERDAVVWRKGFPAATLRTLLTNAGVSVPGWIRSSLVGVSADGSTVVGNYTIGTEPFTRTNGFAAVLPASNDTCETARSVTYGTTIDSTKGATRAGANNPCASEGTAPDVWFSFVPAASETVTLDTCGSDFDTTLAIYQASTCGSIGNPLACNDDANPACSDNVHASRLSASVFANQNYFIRVSGWNGAYGSIRLTITAPNRPSNDTCANAMPVPVGFGTGVTFTNVNAITDARPNCLGAGTPFGDVWFRSVAPQSGRLTFSTCGSTINTVMIVYDGSACGDVNAPAIVCGQANSACSAVGGGAGTRITVPCVAGQAFLVRVGGLFGATGSGVFFANFACDADVYSPYSAAVRNSGPLDYYRFEDSGQRTAADAIRFDAYSCGDNRGEYVGNVQRPNDFHGKCLSLDGTGGHVRIFGATPLTNPNGCAAFNEAILEAWVKTTDPVAGVVMTNRNNPGEHSLTMVVGYNTVGLPNTAGRVMLISDGPGNFFGAISGARVDDGRWHHIVGHRYHDGGSTYYYSVVVDDVWQGTNNLPGVGSTHFGTSGSYWLIGNGTAWPVDGAAFNGKIDEVAIYCGNWPTSVWTNHYLIGRPCVADFDDGSGSGNPDGGVTIDDLLYFLDLYSSGVVRADVDDGSENGHPDGGVGIEDLLYYLLRFDLGC
jgi:hypothetical protein